jgi:hypothetical protein
MRGDFAVFIFVTKVSGKPMIHEVMKERMMDGPMQMRVTFKAAITYVLSSIPDDAMLHTNKAV